MNIGIDWFFFFFFNVGTSQRCFFSVLISHYILGTLLQHLFSLFLVPLEIDASNDLLHMMMYSTWGAWRLKPSFSSWEASNYSLILFENGTPRFEPSISHSDHVINVTHYPPMTSYFASIWRQPKIELIRELIRELF